MRRKLALKTPDLRVDKFEVTCRGWPCVERYVKWITASIYAGASWTGPRFQETAVSFPPEMDPGFCLSVFLGVQRRISRLSGR